MQSITFMFFENLLLGRIQEPSATMALGAASHHCHFQAMDPLRAIFSSKHAGQTPIEDVPELLSNTPLLFSPKRATAK